MYSHVIICTCISYLIIISRNVFNVNISSGKFKEHNTQNIHYCCCRFIRSLIFIHISHNINTYFGITFDIYNYLSTHKPSRLMGYHLPFTYELSY